MKTIVHFPIDEQTKLFIKVGDKIDAKTIIGEMSLLSEDSLVPIAELLHIKADSILKYLEKRIGEKVWPGDIIAKKKSFLSSCLVKSPLSGKLKEINLKKGTLTISSSSSPKKKKITIPVRGRIKSIAQTYLEVETEGEILPVHKGGGEEVVGKVYWVENEKVGVLDISSNVEERIVICNQLSDEALVKLEVLDVIGLITKKSLPETRLPWVQVSEEVFEKLSTLSEKTVWLRPKEKEIVILE